ncbi:hypothetical protein HZY97_12915 [Sphingomonas sp. R-74633]|uniref:hypothetical protein n=1 Tax=Sphingomonas sp. R-74633 TaxID=2751188 RepID=UPI0015D39A0A|nr:hypothetical protein [Sphingomonas sp. R-74633]NYT41666.1 hypothetical protein [Sphingomonas sp. R-74633]
MHELFPNSPAYRELQPLRIPAGWAIAWNELSTTGRVEDGYYGGSSVFYAVNKARRFAIDVAFSPEFDPAGCFHLNVIYQPWPRTEKGRRRQDLPFDFDDKAEDIHSFETRSYVQLIVALEHWIAKCTVWEREGN